MLEEKAEKVLWSQLGLWIWANLLNLTERSKIAAGLWWLSVARNFVQPEWNRARFLFILSDTADAAEVVALSGPVCVCPPKVCLVFVLLCWVQSLQRSWARFRCYIQYHLIPSSPLTHSRCINGTSGGVFTVRSLYFHYSLSAVTNKHHFTDGPLLYQFRMNFRRRRRLLELLQERGRGIPETHDSPFCLRKQNSDGGNTSFLSGENCTTCANISCYVVSQMLITKQSPIQNLTWKLSRWFYSCYKNLYMFVDFCPYEETPVTF